MVHPRQQNDSRTAHRQIQMQTGYPILGHMAGQLMPTPVLGCAWWRPSLYCTSTCTFPVRGQNAPVGGEQRVLHHFTQQHPICTVLDARHTLHSRKWFLEQKMAFGTGTGFSSRKWLLEQKLAFGARMAFEAGNGFWSRKWHLNRK